ncbi:hypothetical protein [Gordonia oryzae]|uniref:hypothetical protein n=1 Tax=Gordonia oryzae TaxID=2487349 RepID=UPI000F511D7F|nr:hypothetical protein [Gordonia oryzae]
MPPRTWPATEIAALAAGASPARSSGRRETVRLVVTATHVTATHVTARRALLRRSVNAVSMAGLAPVRAMLLCSSSRTATLSEK